MFYPTLRIFGSMFNYIIPIGERQQAQVFQANKKLPPKKCSVAVSDFEINKFTVPK